MASAAQILEAVEDRAVGEQGALLVLGPGEDPRACVLVQDRRVCWAYAPGHARRLRALLSDAVDDGVEGGVGDAVASLVTPVDGTGPQAILGQDSGAWPSLRAALYQHTIESIALLHGDSTHQLTWVPHRSGGYRARDTFAPVELLAAVGATLYPGLATLESHPVGQPIDRIISGATRGQVVAIDDAAVLVEVTVVPSVVHAGIREVTRVADWSVAALDACGGFSRPVLARSADLMEGPAVLAWRRSRRVVQFAIVPDPRTLPQAVSAVTRAGAPAVLSSWRALRPR